MRNKQEGAHYMAGRAPGHKDGENSFELVRAPDGYPQITLDPNGFKSMDGAHIYKLSEDLRQGFLVKSRQPKDADSPPIVHLSEDQRQEIAKIIEAGKFI